MNPITTSILVAAGGAIGATSRFWVAVVLNELAGRHLPFATFATNVVGSFLIGVAALAIGHQAGLTAFVMVGILGGFTTFSTFSLETVRLFEAGRTAEALAYAGLSAALCVVAAALGMALVRAMS